ncbi:MAG TPA: hypothetical protein VM308_08240 [Sphingomicrobium sp.]|nr:hypothetical protein [Sphingomicrobium sp.]
MPRIPPLDEASSSPFSGIMRRRPEVAARWAQLDGQLRFHGLLAPELKEQVRRTLAQLTGCAYCASLGLPDPAPIDPRTPAATRFATSVAQSPTGVADEDWAELEAHFSPDELVELTCWISFMFASEMFGAMMRLEPADELAVAQYEEMLRRGFEAAKRPQHA